MNRIKTFAGLAAVVLLVGAASLAQAQNSYYWNTGSDNWSNSANWSVLPANGTFIGASIINNNGTAYINTGDNVGDGSGYQTVVIGGVTDTSGNAGANGYVNMSGGILANSGTCISEFVGTPSANGVFTQTGGVNSPYVEVASPGGSAGNVLNYSSLQLGFQNGGYGEYDMSGGSLGVNEICVGANSGQGQQFGMFSGTGVFTQTGGSVGYLDSVGGHNGAVGLAIGGNWGGQSVAQAPHTTASSGIYTLGTVGQAAGAGGPLFVGGFEIVGGNGTGTFTQNSGTNAIIGGGKANGSGQGSYSTYQNVNGGLILGWTSGYQAGTSYFSSPATGYFGNAVGTYNLNGGILTGSYTTTGVGGEECVGVGGTGIFNQSGGTNIASDGLYVGVAQMPGLVPNGGKTPNGVWGGNGQYNLSAGLLQVPYPVSRRDYRQRRQAGHLHAVGRYQPNQHCLTGKRKSFLGVDRSGYWARLL